MKTRITRRCCVALVFLWAGIGLFAMPAIATGRPNIVFVLADDLGWAELGCYGNTFNETPHLDRLAREGTRLTQAYAAAPVCSPYRAALLSGQHPARVGIVDYLRPNSANALSTAHVTLAEVFERDGYATGIVGKWHLTGYKFHGAEHEVVRGRYSRSGYHLLARPSPAKRSARPDVHLL